MLTSADDWPIVLFDIEGSLPSPAGDSHGGCHFSFQICHFVSKREFCIEKQTVLLGNADNLSCFWTIPLRIEETRLVD